MSRGHFVGLNYHRTMLRDEARMETYRRAIAQTVRPGDVVLDLGTGTGVLAMWAAQAGARKVYAVEPAPVVRLAQRLARDNADGDRIEFIEAPSQEIDLPEPADVLVTECMGNFFVTDELAPVLRDAARHLTPEARIIPGHIRLYVAPVFFPFLHDIDFWSDPVHGLDMSAARDFALQTTYVRHVDPELTLAEPALLTEFGLLESPDEVGGRLSWTLGRSGTLHGFAGWFDAELTDKVTLSTGPGTQTHWAQLIFPIEPEPIAAGERATLELSLSMDSEYRSRWRWWGNLEGEGGRREFSHDTDRRFG